MSIIPIGEIHLKCPNCGSDDQFTFPDDATEDTLIVCNACGQAVCTVGELNDEVIAKGRSMLPQVAKTLRKRLKLR